MKKLSKKKWAAIISGIITVLTVLVSLLSEGCSNPKHTDYIKTLDSTSLEAIMVCSTVPLFIDHQEVTPGNCLKAIDKLNAPDKQVIYDAAFCVSKHSHDSFDLKQCLLKLDWAFVAEKISKLKHD